MEAAFPERTGYLHPSHARNGEIGVVETQEVSLGFWGETLYKHGSFSLPWINLIFILCSNGRLHEQLKKEQLGYKLGFNPPQTPFATVWKLLRYREPCFICKLGKISHPASPWSLVLMLMYQFF